MFRVRIFLTILLFCVIAPLFVNGGERLQVRSISEAQSDSLARMQVYYRGRVVPFHTVAHDVTLKLTGKTHVGQLNEVRFVASLMLFPEDWKDVELFKVKDGQLAGSLGVNKGDKISVASLFDENESYRLQGLYRGGDKGLDKAILELDEKVEILLLLRTNSLFLPVEISGHPPLSEKLISLEIFYNKFGVVRWLFMSIFGLALLASLKPVRLYWIPAGLLVLPALFNFICRWILGGHIPLAGGEQVMMFMTLLLLIFATIFFPRNPWIAVGALWMGGFTSLVARLSSSEPIVTSLSPALDSPWLAFHVSVIMASYAVFAIILPLSLAGEFLSLEKAKRLLRPTYLLNLIGVILLGIGIILGSLWAKGAWGSYWQWDPKENWAAVTFIAYLLPLCFKRFISSRPRLYNAILICSFLSMVVTYYGVNYMSSLHSYGS